MAFDASVVSLPRLEQADWRVDLAGTADSTGSVARPAPIALIKLQVMPQREHVDNNPVSTSLTFEANSQTLKTLLDGLHEIKAVLDENNTVEADE